MQREAVDAAAATYYRRPAGGCELATWAGRGLLRGSEGGSARGQLSGRIVARVSVKSFKLFFKFGQCDCPPRSWCYCDSNRDSRHEIFSKLKVHPNELAFIAEMFLLSLLHYHY